MAYQRQIADRDRPRAAGAFLRIAETVAECIKLLDIAKRQAGLAVDPTPQSLDQRSVPGGIERPARQAKVPPEWPLGVIGGLGFHEINLGGVVADGDYDLRQLNHDPRNRDHGG